MLDVRLRTRAVASQLYDALSGRGAPLGVMAANLRDDCVSIDLDDARTELATLVATIDAVLGGAWRHIEPRTALDDDTLARFAGALLGIADLDAERVIETHVARFAAGDRPA